MNALGYIPNVQKYRTVKTKKSKKKKHKQTQLDKKTLLTNDE